jgi:hypothetical protein
MMRNMPNAVSTKDAKSTVSERGESGTMEFLKFIASHPIHNVSMSPRFVLRQSIKKVKIIVTHRPRNTKGINSTLWVRAIMDPQNHPMVGR